MQRSVSPTFRRLRLVLPVLTFATTCSACDERDQNGDDHDSGAVDPCDGVQPLTVGASAEGEFVRVRLLEATPSQPIRGDNAWIVSLTDHLGEAIHAAAVDVVPWMPDHGHGTSVGAEITDRGEGEIYADPINLWMAGVWEVRYRVTLEDGSQDTAVLMVCVD